MCVCVCDALDASYLLCCSVLQYLCCSVCVVACGSVLQRVAMCCSVLQACVCVFVCERDAVDASYLLCCNGLHYVVVYVL